MVVCSIIIPTLNGLSELKKNEAILMKLTTEQSYEVIIVDSGSTDGTKEWAEENSFKLLSISKRDFNHGGTRNLAAKASKGDILVFLTQDAILIDTDSIDRLISSILKDESVGMAYGRQLPHKNAKLMGAFARIYNYPEKSEIKSINRKSVLGIKTVFCSNSFAAYRKEYLEKIGNFPNDVILGEDTYVCGKLLLSGYKCVYNAEAKVEHSHDYSIWEEFKRYFDIGVFHAKEFWIVEEFNSAEGEGSKFVIEQFKYILKKKSYHRIPELILRNGMKYIGYKLGRSEKKIKLGVKMRMTMHKSYWFKS
ncbi:MULTISPECIES: glycosyltransferase family 2 protein [Shouchella]|uniref:glycosyltransferase family 2 protein n=1 Tax=Shouchella TaxID=2893057 RepID=UPI000BA5BD0B|nr:MULTISPECIES: glycosyltransferase [Shouchella]MCM3378793.1 glycosyltransferase [Shouchella rhizosphaerae]PAD17292.1 glycosyl transferase [Shouchella clausii]